MRTDVAQNIELAGLAVDTHFGNQGDERGEMPPKRDAAADSDILLLVVATRRTFRPAETISRDAYGVAVARVCQVLQAEIDRIGIGGRSHFVHERFAAKQN